MSYKLAFKKDALKEWKKLDKTIQEQFKKKLGKILENPLIPSARLSGFNIHECYKIKLRQSGYRLVYEVHNNTLVVTVISVGKRNCNQVYKVTKTRLDD